MRKVCAVCGAGFEASQERAAYCSFACKQEANRRRARERNRRLRAEELEHRKAVLGW